VIIGVPEVAPSFAKMALVWTFAHAGLKQENLPLHVLAPELHLAKVPHAPAFAVNPMNEKFSLNWLIQKITLAATNIDVLPELKHVAHVIMVVPAAAPSFAKMAQVWTFAHAGSKQENPSEHVLAPELHLAKVLHAPEFAVNPMNDKFSLNWPIQKITLAATNIDVLPELNEFPGLAHVIMVVPAVVQSFVKMVQVSTFAHAEMKPENPSEHVLAHQLNLGSVRHVPARAVNPTNDEFSLNWPILKMTVAAMNIDVFEEMLVPGLAHVIMVVPVVVQPFVKMVQVSTFAHAKMQLENPSEHVLAPELHLAKVRHVLTHAVHPMNEKFSLNWPIPKMTFAAMNIDVLQLWWRAMKRLGQIQINLTKIPKLGIPIPFRCMLLPYWSLEELFW